MKRIKFEKFYLNWYRVTSIIIALLLIILGSGLFFSFKNQGLLILGFVLILFELSRFFWFKTFVKYNSKHIYIRINSFLGRVLNFNDIKKVEVTSTEMIIAGNSTNYIIDLHKIDRNDIDDLGDILASKSNAKYINKVMHEKFYKKTPE